MLGGVKIAKIDVRVWRASRRGLEFLPKALTHTFWGLRDAYGSSLQVGEGLQDLGTNQRKTWPLHQRQRGQSK